jgi:2-keto-4-pentenoate hydratase/2-oxohepta-3-ene-1,7-dioic acid hydratase in catechol pathway
MRLVRFTAPESAGVGTDPQFGVLNDQDQILVLRGDPIYSGIVPSDSKVALADVRLLAPVIPRSKVPAQPIIFIKPNTTVIGPNDTIQWPAMSAQVDFEGELAIVIGRICKEVPREKVSDVIYGYTIANDVTARDLQKVDGQWSRAKGFDTFCPLGPWIETDFVPGSQKVITTLNGEVKQSEPLTSMIFSIPEIVEFVTSVMTLLPGDVILTGTPAGIGPMQAGDTVTVSIDGLGSLSNKISPRAH